MLQTVITYEKTTLKVISAMQINTIISEAKFHKIHDKCSEDD